MLFCFAADDMPFQHAAAADATLRHACCCHAAMLSQRLLLICYTLPAPLMLRADGLWHGCRYATLLVGALPMLPIFRHISALMFMP